MFFIFYFFIDNKNKIKEIKK